MSSRVTAARSLPGGHADGRRAGQLLMLGQVVGDLAAPGASPRAVAGCSPCRARAIPGCDPYVNAGSGAVEAGTWAGTLSVDGDPIADIRALEGSARNLVPIVGDGRIHRHWSAAPPAWRLACLRWGSSRARPPRPAFHRLAATVPACAEAAAPRPETFATLDVVVSVDSRRTSCGQARGGQTIHSLLPSGHVVCPHPMTPKKSSENNKL